MFSRVLGSILLIVAMSIGGGLLSLPVVTAAAGFSNSLILLTGTWLVMTVGSLFILEVCLKLPEDTNLIAMAKHTLGVPGQIFTWLFYLLMLYCIMCVYVSGGTDLVKSISIYLHVHLSNSLSAVLFVLILGAFVWRGIKLVDYANRFLILIKMFAYVLLLAMLLPSISNKNLPLGHFSDLSGAVLPAVFSFGYAIIIPSIRSYLRSDVKLLRLVVIIGGFIPLLCFIAWNYVLQDTMSQATLVAMSHSGKVISQLNAGLTAIGNPWVATLIHIFTTVCLFTAFLAVSLSLSDFIADGINRKKEGGSKYFIYALTFLPPLIIIIFQPYIFITAIRYAGIFVVMILILLPTLMIWKTRRYQYPGGNKGDLFSEQILSHPLIVLAMILTSAFLLFFSVMRL